jgi:hypothetical protein
MLTWKVKPEDWSLRSSSGITYALTFAGKADGASKFDEQALSKTNSEGWLIDTKTSISLLRHPWASVQSVASENSVTKTILFMTSIPFIYCVK